jgi:hypothetical protein
MDHVFMALAAIGGGAFGAAIGGNYAFVFTGLAILAGTGAVLTSGDTSFIGNVAFGPVFGPHISFAGAVAAAAYAGKKGYAGCDNEKDIITPLAGTGKVDVIAVGGLFGLLGYFVQFGISKIPWFGGHTDSVALTVVISAIIVRFVFGNGDLLGLKHAKGLLSTKNKEGEDVFHWLPWQETPAQVVGYGFLFGLAAAFMGVILPTIAPGFGGGFSKVIPFAFSAITIFILNLGGKANTIPVSHQMTIAGGLGGTVFYAVLNGGDPTAALADNWGAAIGGILLGALCGVLGSALGEIFARIWWNRSNTHIDPPASSIWISTLIIAGIAGAAGVAGF